MPKNYQSKIKCLIFLMCLNLYASVLGMSLSGSISAVSVAVNGDISVSSMTISTLTITNSLNIGTPPPYISGRVVQMKYASKTNVILYRDTTTWTAVLDLAPTITLANANDYVRISLSGGLRTEGVFLPCYISIFRDSTNLGDAQKGLSETALIDSPDKSIGITIIDFPGDTYSHTYQPYILATDWPNNAYFPWHSTGYIILEEISQ